MDYRKYQSEDHIRVTIPNHKGDFPKATVKSIMKQAKITGVIL